MNELRARRLAMILTFKCTLKCKLCCNFIPLYENPPIVPIEELKRDMQKVFGLYDYIEWFQFVGGEPFVHPDFAELLEESYKYREQFDKIVIMSNATIVPNDRIVKILKKYDGRCMVNLSDYGNLSKNIEKIVSIFEENSIPYKRKIYHGDMQHYGGWFDDGGFVYQNYGDAELETVFRNCAQTQMKNQHMYRGKIYGCTRALNGDDLGLVKAQSGEYLDVYDESTTLEEKRHIISTLSEKPVLACSYCKGHDTNNAKRYPAAEQIK